MAAKLSVRVRLSLVATVAALYCHTRTRLVQSLVVFDGIDDDDGGGDGDGNEEDAMNVMTVIMMMRFSCSVMCGGSGRMWKSKPASCD